MAYLSMKTPIFLIDRCWVNKAKPDAAYITLQGFEALKILANGNSTKIIVPSEIQNVAGLLSSMSEVVKDPKTTKKSK